MSDTPHLGLPLIAAAQAQKHVTHNEALMLVDALLQLAVISRVLTSPPGSPDEGDRYLISAPASDDWLGHDGELACFIDGVWRFVAPEVGWRVWCAAEEGLLVFDGTDWRMGAGIDQLDRLGVNTTADDTNRLAVRSNAALFTALYDGDGGNGSFQHKFNKEASADTASQLYQTNFSGRAETGLCGDDNFHIKVSPNGSDWLEALVIKTDGKVGLGTDNPPTLLTISENAEAGPTPLTGALLRIIPADAAASRLEFVSAGAGGQLAFRRSGGTMASPGAMPNNNIIANLAAFGHDGSGWLTGSNGTIQIWSAEEFSPSGRGTRIRFAVTPIGSTTIGTAFTIAPDGALQMGAGEDTIIDGNRHVRPRQYAAGALPSQDAGDVIASSDVLEWLISDGSEWLSPGVKRLRTVTANTAISIPAGWAIAQIHFAETAGNAVTGGIKIGTSAGATDVVAVQAVGGNALDTIADASILKKVFSRSAAQTLHIQAVTGWNSASVELSFVLRKVF